MEKGKQKPAEMNTKLKAPFPYFGGKSKVADIIWRNLGDVKQYIEPFFGSGAVLLKRPPTKYETFYEIVNDKDGFIANVWRSIRFSPDEVAKWCDWPINHADLNARRKILIANETRLLENLQNDDMWHDPKMAGYWIWAASCWIGSGLVRPNAIPYLGRDTGIVKQRPTPSGNQGILEKRPRIVNDRGNTINVYEWINALSKRLRNVKVVCGDWKRVCGGNWQDRNKPVGMFFDPPYMTSGRDEKIYHHESMTVGGEVEKWCLERGKNPNYRIVVAGYEDEYQTLLDNGWTVVAWVNNGGYANQKSGGSKNRFRERLYISPHCCK